MHLGLTQPFFYLLSLWFMAAIAISWVVPGLVILKLLKLKDAAFQVLVALPVGLAFWGIQGYIFGTLDGRWLSYVYLLGFGIWFMKDWQKSYWPIFQAVGRRLRQQPPWFWLLVTLSTGLQLFAHIGSGFVNEQGLTIYFVNAVDGVMHLGYIEAIKTNFPPFEPGAVGYQLVNYHYWSDLILAELSRVWGLPTMQLFFQWVPILLTVWTLLMVSKLILRLGGDRKTVVLAIFFLTLGGDAAYIFTQLLHGTWGEKVSSLDSGVTFIFNFPQMVARTTFIAALLLLIEWWQSQKTKVGLLASVLIGTLFGFKVYYGLYSVIGLGSLFTLEAGLTFLKNLKQQSFHSAIFQTLKAQFSALLMVAVLGVVALSIYLPVNKGAGGLTYSPLEWPRLLLSADNIDFRDWSLRMQVYQTFGNTRNIIILNLVAIAMTFVAVYGTRMVGVLPLTFPLSGIGRKIWFFFVPANLVFILLGLFTLQTSGGLNIFNFLIVPIFAFNLFSAFTISRLPRKILLPTLIFLIALTVPRSLFQLQHFYRRYSAQTPDLAVTSGELAAFSYLQTQTPPDAVVQAPPTNGHDQLTPYVAYFSHRPSYMAGISMLESHNQPTKDRQNQLKAAFALTTFSDKRDALRDLGIDYLVFSTDEYQKSGFTKESVVFESEKMVIIKLP